MPRTNNCTVLIKYNLRTHILAYIYFFDLHKLQNDGSEIPNLEPNSVLLFSIVLGKAKY